MAKIKHRLWIGAPIEEVYEAISTLKGIRNWWTPTNGMYSIGGQIRTQFDDGTYNLFDVLAIVPNRSISWRCAETTFPDKDWKNTTITFALSVDEEGDVTLDFEHDGWKEMNNFYGMCNYHWANLLNNLKEYCETGEPVVEN